jgi:alpha-tubulin suppressor-like RCC1 family protein
MNASAQVGMFLSLLAAITVSRAAVLYVDQNSTNPIPPYSTWATAANVIQDAVDAAPIGGLVLVTDGIYETGLSIGPDGTSNRVMVTKSLTLQSLNGPASTIIRGYQVPGTTNGAAAVRCLLVSTNVQLSGFTLANGATHVPPFGGERGYGGGVYCSGTGAVISNCVFLGNSASDKGGGVWGGTLINCNLSNNIAHYGGGAANSTLTGCNLASNKAFFGGGAAYGQLTNCVLVGNSTTGSVARRGGGAYEATLFNCTLLGNAATSYGGGAYNSRIFNCNLSGNTAGQGGGAYDSSLVNSALYNNSSGVYSSILTNCTLVYNGLGATYSTLYNSILYDNTGTNHANSTLNYCCTTPLPASGTNNITMPPLLVSPAAGNLRLQTNSPCRDAGDNSAAVAGLDLDGNARISKGTVDMGAYEIQPPAPFAHTAAATDIRPSSATLNGFASPNGESGLAWFEWGVKGAAAQVTPPVTFSASTGVTRISTTITNLQSRRVFFCRLVVSNEAAIVRGAARLFSASLKGNGWGYNFFGQGTLPPSLTNLVTVVGGGYHNLALRSDGTVVGWGNNANDQTNIPVGLSNVIAIAAGSSHSLALQSDGTVTGWGLNDYGQSASPSSASNVVELACGNLHSAALRADGTVIAWGFNGSDETNVPTNLSNVVALAAGSYHTLALKDNGTVVGWGAGVIGPARSVPANLNNVVAIEGGGDHSIALKSDGTVVAWGDNYSSQTNVPVNVSNAMVVGAGGSHNLVLMTNGTLAAWGYNFYGQINIPISLSNVVAIAAGWWHNLALVEPTNRAPYALAQFPAGTTDQDVVVSLTGGDLDNDAINFWIVAPPLVGSLYQYDDGNRGTPISTNGTVVSDAAGRIIFAPAPNGFGNPYSSFDFATHDGAVSSPAARITIRIDPPAAPFAFTHPAIHITTNTATMRGMATPNWMTSSAWFEWGTNTNYGQTTAPQPIGNGRGVVALNAAVTNLPRGVVHHFRLISSNALGVTPGANQTFITGGRIKAWGYNNSGQTNVPPSATNPVAIAAGGFHSLALLANGSALGWGSNSDGQRNPPTSLSNAVSLFGGGSHSLALRSDGSVTGWGWNNYGQATAPTNLNNAIAVSAAVLRSMALRADGTLIAWGDNSVGQSAIPTDLQNVVALALGATHNVALRADGTVACWGYGTIGQLDLPQGLTNIIGIAAGNYHSLALRRDGTVFGWGSDTEGQATPPPGLTNVVSIHAQASHSYAMRSDGTIAAWGNNGNGEISIAQATTNAVLFAAGYNHNLALFADAAPSASPQSISVTPNTDAIIQFAATDPENDPLTFIIKSLPPQGTLYQYASGLRGAAITNADTVVTDVLGRVIFAPDLNGIGKPYTTFTFVALDGTLESPPTPVTITIIGPFFAFTRPANTINNTNVQLNGLLVMKIFPATSWFEWGTNTSYGQTSEPWFTGGGVGFGQITQHLSGLTIGQPIHYRFVASNASQIIYGMDHQFTLSGKVIAWGDDSSGQSAAPTNLGAIVSVAGGLSHSLALRADGKVVAWGNNTHGQTNVPASLAGVTTIAAGGFHNLALRTNGLVVAWGRNNFGQVSVPANVSNIFAIAAGGQHSVAIRGDGSVFVWGDNSQRQQQVPTGNFVSIAAGWYHSVALRSDSTVMAWGANNYGQTNVPAGLTNIVWVGAGLYHCLALRDNGTLIAWGLNSSGQTNIPGNLTNTIVGAGGGSHNLALQADDTFSGWGFNFYGQATPPLIATNVVSLAAGGSHSLALLSSFEPVAFDQTVAGYPNMDLPITLLGALPDNTSLSYRISSVPAVGALYQFTGGTRGAPIVAANTLVTDALGRIIFAPPADQAGSPHTAFNFQAGDGLIFSPPASVTVNIVLPSPPAFDLAASGLTTNHTFQLAFTGATNATYRVWASTNLVNWELLGPASAFAPGAFLFLDSTATNWPQRFYRATAP